MSTFVSITTTLCDWDTDVDWDGEHIRLMLFSKVPGIKDGVLTGMVLLSPNTVLKMNRSLNHGINLAFSPGKQKRKPPAPANVLKFEKPQAVKA